MAVPRRWRLTSLAVVVGLAAASCVPAPYTPPPPPGGVVGIGDSVMLGGANALRGIIPGFEVDAQVSRQFSAGIDVVASRAANGRLPATFVIHLGTNGNIGDAACDRIIAAAAGRRVVLVNIKVPRAWEAGNNVVLANCAARNGVPLVDWKGSSAGQTGLFAADGYHLTSAGAHLYATLISRAL
jgi:hypothetical protein